MAAFKYGVRPRLLVLGGSRISRPSGVVPMAFLKDISSVACLEERV